jgi:hypothetical protein
MMPGLSLVGQRAVGRRTVCPVGTCRFGLAWMLGRPSLGGEAGSGAGQGRALHSLGRASVTKFLDPRGPETRLR